MKMPVILILLLSFCLLGNSQVSSKTIPVTTSSKKALAFYNEAINAYQDVDLINYNPLLSKALGEDPDFFMANYQKAMFAAYLNQEKNFIKFATAAASSKAKLSLGEKLLKDAVTQLVENRNSDLTSFGIKLVEMYPEDVNSHLNLYTFQYLKKDIKGGISTLNNALKLSERKDYLYNLLAYAYMDIGQFKEAETALDRYIALSPQLPNPYDSKGDLYMRTKEYAKAYENFMKAYNIDTAWSKGKALKAKSLAEQVTQAKLMKKFCGTWQSGNVKDTLNLFELIEYNNALLQINSRVVSGVKGILVTCTYTYDLASGDFKSFALWPGGRLETWRVRFTSDKDAEFVRVEDFKANTVMYKNTVTLDDPDHLTGNNYNRDNVKTGTTRWVRTGADLFNTKAGNIDQMALMKMQVGRWRSDISQDSALISEWQRFGNAFTNITYDVIKGEKKVRFTQNLIYSSNEGRFRTFVAYPNGNYLTYLSAYTSDSKWAGAFVSDFKADEIIRKFEAEFLTPRQMTVTYFNKEGVKTMEIKWYKVE